jgi:hypothetical protein
MSLYTTLAIKRRRWCVIYVSDMTADGLRSTQQAWGNKRASRRWQISEKKDALRNICVSLTIICVINLNIARHAGKKYSGHKSQYVHYFRTHAQNVFRPDKYRRPFYCDPSTAASLSHRKPASARVSHDSCRAERDTIKGTLYFSRVTTRVRT